MSKPADNAAHRREASLGDNKSHLWMEHRSYLKIPDQVRGQGAGRRKSGAYTEYVSILSRPVTPPSGLRRVFETASNQQLR